MKKRIFQHLCLFLAASALLSIPAPAQDVDTDMGPLMVSETIDRHALHAVDIIYISYNENETFIMWYLTQDEIAGLRDLYDHYNYYDNPPRGMDRIESIEYFHTEDEMDDEICFSLTSSTKAPATPLEKYIISITESRPPDSMRTVSEPTDFGVGESVDRGLRFIP